MHLLSLYTAHNEINVEKLDFKMSAKMHSKSYSVIIHIEEIIYKVTFIVDIQILVNVYLIYI